MKPTLRLNRKGDKITIEEMMNIPRIKTFEEGLGAKKGIMYILEKVFED